jgi:hypothetical protein
MVAAAVADRGLRADLGDARTTVVEAAVVVTAPILDLERWSVPVTRGAPAHHVRHSRKN